MSHREEISLEVVTIYNFSWIFIKTFFQLLLNMFLLLYDILQSILDGLIRLVKFIVKFLGPVAGSVYKSISQQELYRTIALSASSGTGVLGFLDVINHNMEKIIIDPVLAGFLRAVINGLQVNYFSVVVAITIFVGDLLRRYFQGNRQLEDGRI